ncbi:uncharacterized protein KY384_007226 [Bacidia gigantensis]|uniref:uncharacterized protein n=1 Tax=Bacidia gigantensis TaxID=2732470 RepID=UPI001D05B8E8|nr:uncharacterized protein KY384_007226 [Bacidia gigantensis]KAG8528309.1 hypothetical protein KY384_007226 [Bacidia gigantensis]
MDTSTSNDNKVWYDANCHCRAVQLRFRVTPLFPTDTAPSPEPLKPFNCNCSICTKNGYLNVYPKDADTDIEWIKGQDSISEYRWGTKEVGHKFCPICGSSIVLIVGAAMWGDGSGTSKVGVNARMIKGVDVDKLTVLKKNGKDDWGEKYDP